MSDPSDKLFKLAMAFAEDCGSQALGERNFKKIAQLYKDFAVESVAIMDAAIVEASLNGQYREMVSFLQTMEMFTTTRTEDIEHAVKRIQELKKLREAS